MSDRVGDPAETQNDQGLIWIEDLLFADFLDPVVLANAYLRFCEKHVDNIVKVKKRETDQGTVKLGFSAWRRPVQDKCTVTQKTDVGFNLETALQEYVGADYAEPRKIWIEDILFEDFDSPGHLITSLTEFCNKHENNTVESKPIDDDFSELTVGFSAFRLETADEIEERIAGYRRMIEKNIAERRAEYERLKLEFGDTP